MNKVEHIGIAVENLKRSIEMYSKILNVLPYKIETVESEGVNVAFFKIGDSKIELLESINDNGIIKKFIKNKGEGIHHIAFEVKNIKSEVSRLKSEGFTILNPELRTGADNKMVCFLHPKDTAKVLIELCQSIDIS